ncbi:LptA/OstA family protein [Calothrix sp. NIES-3974]|uniref:LptA/OstA family protein n=1 Tax=Calothrix sp. NIES-3974 TaxID=2005462 RepID=UPI000B6031E3|nr:LptA/OstA family protein [Calothrix sp. NIES-3974]BAZ03420.1 hypothetical protein NIES3974_00460 [Calothrix sp. NIES-3974]
MKYWYQITRKSLYRLSLGLLVPAVMIGAIAMEPKSEPVHAQTANQGRPLQIKSDIQEYDARNQIVTARGNVQMLYAARGIKATAAQAQYFSRERQIVLSGNVYILQAGGNSIRGERVTYLIDQGRFIAQPRQNQQVESIYFVDDANIAPTGNNTPPQTPQLRR